MPELAYFNEGLEAKYFRHSQSFVITGLEYKVTPKNDKIEFSV